MIIDGIDLEYADTETANKIKKMNERGRGIKMGIYKKVLKEERAFYDRKMKDALNNYRDLTYQGKPIYEILGYKSFSGCRGDSAGYLGRTAVYNKIFLKQLDFVLSLMRDKKEIPSLLATCFKYERALAEQSHYGAKAREIAQHPVSDDYPKKLQETMKEYEPNLKIYKSENGISIAYKDYIESSEYLLKEDKELFEMVKHAYLLSRETEINEILNAIQRLRGCSQKVYDRYLSERS